MSTGRRPEGPPSTDRTVSGPPAHPAAHGVRMRVLTTGLLAVGAVAVTVEAVAMPAGPPAMSPPAAVRQTSGRPPGAPPATPRAGRWRWPIVPRPVIARPFEAPGSAWGAGHRGLDLNAADGTLVRAVEGGVVSYVGVIAGRPVVAVTHRDGLRSTYEPVAPAVAPGRLVATGDILGRLVPSGSHCSPLVCLHLGAARGSAYVDPLPLLLRSRVVLLPLA